MLLTPQPTNQWLGYPVARRLSESLGLPVLLDNDAAAAIGEYWLGAVDPTGADFLTEFTRIAAAANAGDPTARSLVEQSAHYLGSAAVTMTSLFDLDTIILAGPSFAVAGSIYQTVIQQQVDRHTFARRAHPVRVAPSANGSDAAAIGGAVLILQSELTLGHPHPARPAPAG